MKLHLSSSVRSLVAVAAMVLLPTFSLHAQTSPADSGLAKHPLAELEKTQPKEGDEYTLGAGDEIVVTVIGRPELTGTHTVGPDGEITIAAVGSIHVEGLTREGAAKAVADVLKTLYTAPSVTVQVTKYGSNKVILFGDVEHPGVMQFDGPPSLIEAITRGGSLISDEKTHRMPSSCIIYRGKDEVGTINLKEAFRSGDVKLHRGDLIYVPGDQEKLISVLGEVHSPRPVPLKDESTLISLITDAGGLTAEAGNNPNIQIINPSTGKIQTAHLNDLLHKSTQTDVTLAVGDIIFVPKSGIAKVGFVLQQLAPAAQVGTIAAIAATY